MAFPTDVNPVVTDAITATNVAVLGLSPAIAMGELYVATSQALANAAHNATYAQQKTNMLADTVTNVGLKILNGIKV